MLHSHLHVRKIYELPASSGGPVLCILVVSVCYLSVLSFINARGVSVSPAIVGLVEAAIFSACMAVIGKKLQLATIAFSVCVAAWIIFTWVARQSLDAKSLRDLIIPLMFISLGRYAADADFADRCLKLITGIVVVLAVFEVAFTDAYASMFNSFTFYMNIAGFTENAASFKGQMLSLNGYRPEGIGRTILPMLFGSHRASSVFMEPIGLGNFAMIILAWGLSKPLSEMRSSGMFIVSAAVIVTLCDSRFGLLMSGVLLACRCVPVRIVGRLAPAIPIVALSVLLGLTMYAPSLGDNLHGRITTSGMALLQFDPALLMGLKGPLPAFGDMGFAYLLSRFGAPLSIALIAILFLIPMADQRGVRFRAMIMLYIFANLAISGTSVFALKTAGVMWFLFGALSATQRAAKTAWPDQVSVRPAARATGAASGANGGPA
jgi:putative polymerase